MQICSATMGGAAIEDRYLIKSCKKANVMELHACVSCFLRKDRMLIELKTLIKDISLGNIEQNKGWFYPVHFG